MQNSAGDRFIDDAAERLRGRGLDANADFGMLEIVTEFAERIIAADRTFNDTPAEFPDELRAALFTAALVPGTPLLRRIVSRGDAQATIGGACTVVEYSRSGSKERVLSALSDGAGVGVDLSDEGDPVTTLRELNDDVRDLDDRLRRADRRPVACMATLSSRHPRVAEFIAAKQNEDFLHWRFNISIRMEDYEEERSLLRKPLAEMAHYCAEPGILFWDRVEAESPTPTMLPISTAPCAEVALAEGEQCLFAYLNLVAFVTPAGFDFAHLEKVVTLATRALDDAAEICLNAVEVKPAWAQTRRIGIGIMGFADALIGLGISYAADGALQLADRIARILMRASGMESTRLASSRGPFPLFAESRYRDENWVRSVYARALVDSGEQGDRDCLGAIASAIRDRGIRNASTVAFPPTGNASDLTGVSKSLEPRRSRADIYRGVDALRRYGVRPETLDEAVFVTEDAISGDQHVLVQAAFQRASIDAVSKTVNLPQTATVDDVARVIDLAYETGCKGITVFRDNCLSERAVASGSSELTTVP